MRTKDQPARVSWRHAVVGSVLLLGLGVIGVRGWRDDLRYLLPTPRHPGLVQPPLGSSIELPAPLAAVATPARPLLLHFFNDDCPCSRFNLDHLRALVRDYRDRVAFVAVLPGGDCGCPRDGTPFAELRIPAVADADGSIAARFGVYSTPQAVLLAPDGTLFFRGNYNLSRYCVDRATAFAQQAIEALLAGRPLPAMPAAATIAYGCELPAASPAGGR